MRLMADRRHRHGVTLIEMLAVLGVIVILAGAVIVLTRRIESQSKEKLLANTFGVLDNALGQFYDYEFRYPSPYTELRFPLDCNSFGYRALQTTLAGAMGATAVVIANHNEETETDLVKKAEYLQYSGCEAMYFLLSQVPESRQVLTRIDASLVTNKNMYSRDIAIAVGTRPAEPLRRVVDPWGTTLRYDYYDERQSVPDGLLKTRRAFPVLVSAGPDKRFGTGDDISSRSQ
jgi:prepilin-type N-terminal cleavage/methylation domain-containing protein